MTLSGATGPHEATAVVAVSDWQSGTWILETRLWSGPSRNSFCRLAYPFCCSSPLHNLQREASNQQSQDRPDMRDKARRCLQMNCNNWSHRSLCTLTRWLPRFLEPRLFQTRLRPPAVGFTRTPTSLAQLRCSWL